jgi:RimJ/RimL family protein N-acetyltransferase
MTFNSLPTLEDDMVLIKPLLPHDYEALYAVARDPRLWVHHPISNGYTKEGFELFFSEALTIGSLLTVDKPGNRIIGCTRFYNYRETESSVVIGHTFILKACWGKGYNSRVKKLMLDHAFHYASKVLFYVVTDNIRSQKALEKLGAKQTLTIERNYNGRILPCVIYEMDKASLIHAV